MNEDVVIIAVSPDGVEQIRITFSKQSFRNLQQVVASILGATLRQDEDDSILLRLPNTYPRKQRNNLAKFLLHPEREGMLNDDEVSSLRDALNYKLTNEPKIVQSILNKQNQYYATLTPTKWEQFLDFLNASWMNKLNWSFL